MFLTIVPGQITGSMAIFIRHFNIFDNSTRSNHWIHGYAVLDRLDFSTYLDIFPSSPIDIKCILINDQDVAQLDNAIMLMSR